VNPRQQPRNVQALAGRAALCLHADGTDTGRERGKLVGDFHEFFIQLRVFHPFQHLVIPVQSSMETVVGAAPKTFAKFGVVFPPLPGGREKSQAKP
jgi:hypothetical protein